MRIAQVSDFHFTHITLNPLRLFSKRILGHLNWMLNRNKQFSVLQLEPLPEIFKKLEVDCVFICGDMTTTSMREEFEDAKEFVQKINKPIFAIPGNHDNYIRSTEKDFYQYFGNSALKNNGIDVRELINGWWVISLDTTMPTGWNSAEGLFTEKLEQNFRNILREIPENGSIIVLNHYPFFESDVPRKGLQRQDALRRLLQEDRRIALYLHGHTHRNIVADLQNNDLPIVLDSGSCTETRFGSWNLIELSDEECMVTPYRWEKEWMAQKKAKFQWKRSGLKRV